MALLDGRGSTALARRVLGGRHLRAACALIAIALLVSGCAVKRVPPPPPPPPPPPAAPPPAAANSLPRVRILCPDPCKFGVGERVTLRLEVTDPDGDPLTFAWSGQGGAFPNPTARDAEWMATQVGTFPVTVAVSDGRTTVSATIEIEGLPAAQTAGGGDVPKSGDFPPAPPVSRGDDPGPPRDGGLPRPPAPTSSGSAPGFPTNAEPPAQAGAEAPVTAPPPAPPGPVAPSTAPPTTAPPAPLPQLGAAPTSPFQWALLGVGFVFLVLMVVAAMFVPTPTAFQFGVFRTTLALGAACIAASIPWFFGGPAGGAQVAGVAAGVASVFLLVFLVDPARRIITATGKGGGIIAALPRAAKQSIFISYRRSETMDVVGRLYERLVEHFGQGAVFKDIEGITPGLDFREELAGALQHCRVVLAVIGPEWEHLVNDQQVRRLDDPRDYVVLEIGSALGRRIPVIPVLAHRLTLPSPDAFPQPLADLQYKQAIWLRPDPDFGTDADRLVSAVETLLARPVERT